MFDYIQLVHMYQEYMNASVDVLIMSILPPPPTSYWWRVNSQVRFFEIWHGKVL